MEQNKHTPELLPCPFCASILVKSCQHKTLTMPIAYTFICGDCGAESSSFLKESNPLTFIQAAKEWNTRPAVTKAAPDLLEALTRLMAARELTAASISGSAFINACKIMAEAEKIAYAALAKATNTQ